MQTFHGFPPAPLATRAFLTIGNFDGVHRGHQHLIADLVRAAHETACQAGLLTFEPHPLAVLRPHAVPLRLTSNQERAEVLAALGLDFIVVLPFSPEVAALSAADFMAQVVAHFPLCELWIGPDFALGRGREGNATRLAELGKTLDYIVRVAAPFNLNGEPVRSSRVRSLLTEQGAVAEVAALLGRPYTIWGEVVHGAERGRGLGFPTANLAAPANRALPAHGVYACWAWLDDVGIPAVTNVGVRPTFDNGRPSVEAYLLDFDADIYGETLGLSFIARLRGEQRFPSIEALVGQLHQDVESARRVLCLAGPAGDAEALTWAQGVEAGLWREVAHMADWAIRVTGASQRQIFARAAAAMFALEDADPTRPIELARPVAVAADDPAELMVAWLNALLLGQELDAALYTRFELQEISDRGLRGVAYGYRGSPSHTAIKATTYYDLSVEETPAGWTAQITFDV